MLAGVALTGVYTFRWDDLSSAHYVAKVTAAGDGKKADELAEFRDFTRSKREKRKACRRRTRQNINKPASILSVYAVDCER